MTSFAVRNAVMDMLDAPRIDKFGTVLEPKEKPESSLKRRNWMKNLQTLFSGMKDFDETQKTGILTLIEDNEMKKELSEVLYDPTQMKELQLLITVHSENVKHIIHGYAKLGPVLKIEREMRKISQKITDLKMNYYIAGHSSIKESRDARKTLAREANLSELIDQKEQLLQTKEIVAGYELRKIRNYAQQIDAGQLVQTPSVIALKDTIRTKIMSGQPVLLSGPVGTGKTKIAQEIYQEILEAKHTSGQINDDEYAGLRSTRIYNGNEESTKRDLDSRPTQLSNKADSEQAFTYEEGDITTCLRHGLPLIIDEANRTPPNFLSALKKYFALRPGDSYTDPMTGKSFAVSSPLQVIFTANEGSKYAKDVSRFQDQIKREVERIYIPYLPDDELYDIFKAKLYQHPGLAQVSTHDLTITLPALIRVAHNINDLYLKGEESDVTASSGKKLKLTSAVLDTKRLLQRVDKSLLGGKNSFRSVLNTSLVEFISQQDIDDDRLILCSLFHAQGLLCKENIPALLSGVTSLKTPDLTAILTSSRDQVDKSTGEPLIDPRQLATGYPESAKGRPSHRLHTFDTLDRDDDGTVIKGIMTSIIQAGVFNPLQDSAITTLISKLQKYPDQRGDDDLQTIAQALADRDLSDLGGAELVNRQQTICTILDGLSSIDQTIASLKTNFDAKIDQARGKLSDEEKEKAQEAEAKKRKEGGKNTFNTPRYTLPKTTTLQTYVEMKKNPKTKTYPQYAEWLFAQAGDKLGLQFKYPDNRSEIQDGTVDGSVMVDALNTPDNKAILVKLRELIGFNGEIPLGLDDSGSVIYADVRSDDSSFFRHVNVDYYDCLVPSELEDPHQGPGYIDTLLATPGLGTGVLDQLTLIKNHSDTMQKNGYSLARISIIDGRVAVDGQRFVTFDGGDRIQTLADMQKDPKGKTYPQYAESLFEMAGAMLGKKFQKPNNRGQIQDGTVDGSVMVDALNTPDNKAILVKLREIIGFNGYIPLGLDNSQNKNVIYAYVRSVSTGFFLNDDGDHNYCLVPSKLL